MQTPETKHDLVNALGEDALREMLGLTARAIPLALSRPGPLPAYWWVACRDRAKEVGVECPENLFAFTRMTAARRKAVNA